MKNDDDKYFFNYTFGVIVRGNLPQINRLVDFLKDSGLVLVHQQIGLEKMYIKIDREEEETE